MSLTKTLKKMNKGGSTNLLVTPRIEAFLRQCPDGLLLNEAQDDLAPETKALIEQIMKAAFVGNNDRSGRFGASSRGTCQRRQLFQYLGMPDTKIIDTDSLNLFNDGKFRHLRWQVMGVQSGALTHAEYPLKMPSLRLTSSVDGLNVHDAFLFELKGDRNMARLMDQSGSVVEAHNLQMHTMMLMTGWDVFSYVMEDKSTQQWREVVIKRDPKVIRMVKTEMEELNEHVENRTLPEPLAACQAKEGPYRGCPYAKPCIERWNGGRGGDYWPDTPGNWSS